MCPLVAEYGMVLAMMLMVSSWLKTHLLCQGGAEIKLYWIIEKQHYRSLLGAVYVHP